MSMGKVEYIGVWNQHLSLNVSVTPALYLVVPLVVVCKQLWSTIQLQRQTVKPTRLHHQFTSAAEGSFRTRALETTGSRLTASVVEAGRTAGSGRGTGIVVWTKTLEIHLIVQRLFTGMFDDKLKQDSTRKLWSSPSTTRFLYASFSLKT